METPTISQQPGSTSNVGRDPRLAKAAKLATNRDAQLQLAAQRAVQLFEDEPSPETRIIMRAVAAVFFDQVREDA